MKPANFYLIRGLARESVHWGSFSQVLREQNYVKQIKCLDLPGFGVLNKLTAPLSIQENAEFALSQIDFDDGEPKVIVSISLGSMVAIEMLHRKPGAFDKAFVMNTSFSDLSPFYHRLQLKSLRHFINILRVSTLREKEEHTLRMVSQEPDKWSELIPLFEKAYLDRPYKVSNVVRQLFAASRYQLPKTKLETPIVVFNSLGDEMVAPQCSHDLADHWNLPIFTHESAGHDISIDDPQWVLERIEENL